MTFASVLGGVLFGEADSKHYDGDWNLKKDFGYYRIFPNQEIDNDPSLHRPFSNGYVLVLSSSNKQTVTQIGFSYDGKCKLRQLWVDVWSEWREL